MSSSRNRIVHDTAGLNTGEWPVAGADHFITPIDKFFTRSHAAIPAVDPLEWRLEVGGLVDRPDRFSLERLTGAFPEKTVPATLVCAGLRRDEYLSVGPLPGELPWGPEPVSTGEWSGISLADLLDHVGISASARHVEFIGLDAVERQGRRFGFGASIELAKARSDEVLLATRLNGLPLPPVHGYPLRAIVPGWIGARSVKWLGAVRLTEQPSDNYFQRNAYRVQREPNAEKPRDVTAGVAMSGVPLNAVILDPAPEQVIPSGLFTVRGWAMGSEARPLTRVELSHDGGAGWISARITRAGRWTWSFWEAAVGLAPGSHTLAARATDSGGATQPATVDETWNVKGYGNNAWHRVTISVTDTS